MYYQHSPFQRSLVWGIHKIMFVVPTPWSYNLYSVPFRFTSDIREDNIQNLFCFTTRICFVFFDLTKLMMFFYKDICMFFFHLNFFWIIFLFLSFKNQQRLSPGKILLATNYTFHTDYHTVFQQQKGTKHFTFDTFKGITQHYISEFHIRS